MDNIDIFKDCTTLYQCALLLYGKKGYRYSEKIKKIFAENNVDWKEFLKENKGKTGKYCKFCGKELTPLQVKVGNVYCSSQCFGSNSSQKTLNDWKNCEKNGVSVDGSMKRIVRKYILEKNDYKCEKCGFSGTNPYTRKSILQVHHKDGDCFNTSEENLECLCPNCHAMTQNYGSRNKDCTRQDRRTKKYWLNNIKPTLENND